MRARFCAAAACVALLTGFAPIEGAVFDRGGQRLPDSRVNSAAVNWRLLSIGRHSEYNGVGLVEIAANSHCSGVFLDTGAAPSGPAYVLTNGHCADPRLLDGREIWVDRAAHGGMRFWFNSFFDAGAARQPVAISRVVYATMHATDIAVLELAATYGELTARGFLPYRIAERDPDARTRVAMVGVPQNGVLRSRRFLRMSVCRLDGPVDLREGVYEWFGSFTHQCSSVGGSSGSPMISLDTREIVAIDNTGVDDSALRKPECALDRPCEVDADGRVRTDLATNYAQRVADIATCIRPDGAIDPRAGGCRLEIPSER